MLTALVTLLVATAQPPDTEAECLKRNHFASGVVQNAICTDPTLREIDRLENRVVEVVFSLSNVEERKQQIEAIAIWASKREACSDDLDCLFRNYAVILTHWWERMFVLTEPPPKKRSKKP